jgi:uncharacterized phage infection (PIP) family protein YhgE
MSTGSHIRAIANGTADNEPGETAEGVTAEDPAAPQAEAAWWDESSQDVPRTERRWPAVLAILLVAGWTGVFAWVNAAAAAQGLTASQWIGLFTQWSVPVLLLAVIWLIVMRSSAREAARFGDAARSLANESASLEHRLVTVNRELSLAREFLAAQTRELDYLGRSAAERISEHAAKLRALVIDNSAQVDAIASVSATALDNMTQLRDHLPVIANSARDVTNQIGGAGRTATERLGELVAGFERLNQFGDASERQVVSLRQRIEVTLQDLEGFVAKLDTENAARVAALREQSDGLHRDLEARETEVLEAMRRRSAELRGELVAAHDASQLEEAAALAAMRGRISSFTRDAHDAAAAVRAAERTAREAWESQIEELRQRLETALEEVATLDRQALETARQKLTELSAEAEAVDKRLAERDRGFQERLARRQADFEAAEELAVARLTERAEVFDRELAERHAAQAEHAQELTRQAEALASRMAEIDGHVAQIAQRSAQTEHALAESAGRFASVVGDNAVDLADTEEALARLTDASVRLLELIQGASAHSKSELPASIADFEQRLAAARGSSLEIRGTLDEARQLGTEVNEALAGLHNASAQAMHDLEQFRSGLTGTSDEQLAALAALREQLAAARSENLALAESVSTELTTAIDQLRQASATVLADMENGHSSRIIALAERIGDESAAAIDRAITARTEAAVAHLDEATARSAEASREAMGDLRDQLARVHELTTNLETRAARAREQVEEQVDNDFSRRMALITESLNSHAIDIARALSTEVTDTAWASYLKGDRGVFTRRAVRLIDNGEARAISELFEGDHEFRAHVSRYIHDFEAMLRQMLSTRDGHALGVTLLSSDMGKLYVAMAQAIQRLRQ